MDPLQLLVYAAVFVVLAGGAGHVVSFALMGTGAAERPRAVRWSKAKEIASTWIITIPGSATLPMLL